MERKIKDIGNIIKSKGEKQNNENCRREKCDYVTHSERGLNFHVKRKHTNCDFCDLKVNSESEMKFHIKNNRTLTDSSFRL